MEDSVSSLVCAGHFVKMAGRQVFEKSEYQVRLFRVSGLTEHCLCVLLVRATHGPQDHYTYLSLPELLCSVELGTAFHLIYEFHQHHFL